MSLAEEVDGTDTGLQSQVTLLQNKLDLQKKQEKQSWANMGSIESTISGGEGTCICASPRASGNEVHWLAGSARGQRESSRAGRSGRQSERRRTQAVCQPVCCVTGDCC